MADESAPAHSSDEMAHVSSTAGTAEDIKLLREAASSNLPLHAVKDLHSNKICARCILRQFGFQEHVCSRPWLKTSMLDAVLRHIIEVEEANKESSDRESEKELEVCKICLGILQFIYHDENNMFVKKDCADDFAAAIADIVKREGHQFDSFSLELSIPPMVVENEQAVRSYIKNKYDSQPWFKELSESIASKDFLKFSLTNPLEKLLDVKSNQSSFRIRLTYTLPDTPASRQQTNERNGCNKKRKIDDSHDFKKAHGYVVTEIHCLNVQKPEGSQSTLSSLESENHEVNFLSFPLEEVNKCCFLNIQCYRTSTYIGGRYLKYSRNVSQTCWIIDDERMGEASVEEIIGGSILPICKGDSYKFHAAGREDIDVRMLGTGRPFLVEIQNARELLSDVMIKDMEIKINSLESKLIGVRNLKVLGNQGWELMREGEAEKQKQYAALVWISRPLGDDDFQTLSSIKDMKIMQKTPIRVLHRRSPLGREKIIHWARIEKMAGSSQYFLLHLCTQAGTYIKEFVHGDLGRTHPSIGSILGCRAEILQLDVTDVKMDCFQA